MSSITDLKEGLKRRTGWSPLRRLYLPSRPEAVFHSYRYLQQTQRVQEHLASLGLPLEGRSVLEVGAGIGDHTTFFVDRGCPTTVTEGRPENVAVLDRRFPDLPVLRLDLEHPPPGLGVRADIVYCYGVLYHVSAPDRVIAYLADRCDGMLLLETCVSVGTEERLTPVAEDRRDFSQAISGRGCRPSRSWVRRELGKHFPCVYTTTTQPWHEHFPIDWTTEPLPGSLTRAVFVASHSPVDSPALTTELPLRQGRH